MKPFHFAPTPHLVFGSGSFATLPERIRAHGRTALIVTGNASHRAGSHWDRLAAACDDLGVTIHHATVSGEPSPEVVDHACELFRPKEIDVVVAWGGGSAIDTGKAISAMLTVERPVVDYLEGVGTGEPHPGTKVPFIAVPTTAGTGSEATKNAVLSRVGAGGFKRSLRHDRFVPDVAILDPALMTGCPPDVTAACGLDAVTQLLEAYVSTAASPITDALAESGLARAVRSLVPACTEAAHDEGVRGEMAYAAFLSGVVLANAGLGVVHGLASWIGAAFAIPHGVVCGTLLAESVRITVRELAATDRNHPALVKYAKVSKMMTGTPVRDSVEGAGALVCSLNAWTEQLAVPRLGVYGMTERDVAAIAAASGNKNHPLPLDESERAELLRNRLSALVLAVQRVPHRTR